MAVDGNGLPGVNRPLIPGVRSQNSQKICLVNFKNLSNTDVDVIWITYDGTPEVYGTLPPLGNLKLKTYESHPWIFRDKYTLEKLQVNGDDIFFPTSFETIQLNSVHPILGPVSPYFISYFIHYPLYNLKERAAQVILRFLEDRNRILELDIPSTLKTYITQKKFQH